MVLAVFLFVEYGLQSNAAQIISNRIVQVFPQFMREAGLAAVAVGLAAALGGIEVVFGGGDDLGDIDIAAGAAENVTAAGAANTFHQAGSAQLGKQLF